MKRILAALGVTGLALLGATAPAAANDSANTDHKITICHATGSASNPYVPVTIDLHALSAHKGHQHGEDIIPANDGKVLKDGRNLDKGAWIGNGCAAPGVPPVEEPVVPPVEEPVVPPAVTPETPVVPGETPSGAVVGTPAGAGAVVANNPGFNVQTAVAGSTDVAIAPWAAGLVVMLLAAAGVVARRTLAAGGTVFGPRKE